jgi:hypothetical protein
MAWIQSFFTGCPVQQLKSVHKSPVRLLSTLLMRDVTSSNGICVAIASAVPKFSVLGLLLVCLLSWVYRLTIPSLPSYIYLSSQALFPRQRSLFLPLNTLSACFAYLNYTFIHLDLCLFFFFFLWDWSLNSGLCAYKVDTVMLEPHLQSILLWLFWRWKSHRLFAQAGLSSAFHIARITGMSHWCPASFVFLLLGSQLPSSITHLQHVEQCLARILCAWYSEKGRCTGNARTGYWWLWVTGWVFRDISTKRKNEIIIGRSMVHITKLISYSYNCKKCTFESPRGGSVLSDRLYVPKGLDHLILQNLNLIW